MRASTVLEYPATGATYAEEGMIGAYRYSSYGRDSVLAGQDRRELLGFYPTLFEAKKAHPDAAVEGWVVDACLADGVLR